MTDSNTVNNVNMIVMAFEGFLFVGLAVWYVWSVTQKASSRFWIDREHIILFRHCEQPESHVPLLLPAGYPSEIHDVWLLHANSPSNSAKPVFEAHQLD